jgi:hypothetical protein
MTHSSFTPQQAINAVKAILSQAAGPCQETWSNINANGINGIYTVVASVTVKGSSGQATWTVSATSVTPTNSLASTITNGCP